MTINIIDLISEDAWVDPISEEHEASLIKRAKDGCEASTIALIRQYVPLIKRSINGQDSIDDAAQDALVHIIETIKTHDTDVTTRLASRLAKSLAGAARQSGREGQSHFSIPTTTLKRYNTIVRAAEGDQEKALNLCKTYKMKQATFLHISNMLNNVDVVEEVTHLPSAGGPLDEVVMDSLLCEYAFEAVTEEEEKVIKASYGFMEVNVDGHIVYAEGHSPLAANIVSASLGISTHRTKALKSKALTKMRSALAPEKEVEQVA